MPLARAKERKFDLATAPDAPGKSPVSANEPGPTCDLPSNPLPTGILSASQSISQSGAEACPYPRPLTEVSSWERLTLANRADLLRAIRLLARRFSWGNLRESALSGDLREMQEAIGFYEKINFAKRPGSFYRRPKELPRVCVSEPFPLSRGEVVDLVFQSHFEPRFKPFLKEFSSFEENKTVHVRMWRHPPGESLGTIVAIHGWFMGDPRINAMTLVPGFFYRLGLDVVLYELPYHGKRATGGPNNPSLFPSAHVARTNEGFAQAIYELRALTAWLKTEGHSGPVGAIGLSLGGYTAALWAGLDKLAFVVSVVPLVSIADLAWGLLAEVGEGGAGRLELGDVSLEKLRAVYAGHCPLSYHCRVPVDRRMIIAGTGDPIIPSSQPMMLWEHWEKSRIHWFEGGHLGQIVEGEALKQVHIFLESLGLAHSELLTIV